MEMSPVIGGRRLSPEILLYEGNFDEWQRQTSAMFIANGRPTQAYPAISHIDEDESRTVHYHKTTVGDLGLIQRRITHGLMSRVPFALEPSVGQLYACLEELCKPFRLQDLPAELRNRIYEEAVHSKTNICLLSNNYFGQVKQRVPALAQASRQLREEVLPVYYSINTFETEAHCMRSALGDWKSRVLGSSAKFLSSFKAKVADDEDNPTHGTFAHLDFAFDAVRGLRIECRKAILKPVSKEMIENFTRDVQAEHEGQDLKGELILLAAEKFFDIDTDHWRWAFFDTLEPERKDRE